VFAIDSNIRTILDFGPLIDQYQNVFDNNMAAIDEERGELLAAQGELKQAEFDASLCHIRNATAKSGCPCK
jgi:hypothetical protein